MKLFDEKFGFWAFKCRVARTFTILSDEIIFIVIHKRGGRGGPPRVPLVDFLRGGKRPPR